MSIRATISRLGLAMVAFCAVTLASPGAARADGGAEATGFIQTLGDKAVQVVANKTLTREQVTHDFRELLVAGFDIPAIGRFTLGRYWKIATEDQRRDFLKLFEDMIVQTYANRFSQYSGETFQATGAQAQDADGFLVKSVIMRPATGQPVHVDWRVARVNGQLKIEDVLVEGVSMGVTQRDDFGAVIQRAGGEVSGLLDQMKQRIAQQ